MDNRGVTSPLSSQSHFDSPRDTKFIPCPECSAGALRGSSRGLLLVYLRRGLWRPPSGQEINVFVSFDHFATVSGVCLLFGLVKLIIGHCLMQNGTICFYFFPFVGSITLCIPQRFKRQSSRLPCSLTKFAPKHLFKWQSPLTVWIIMTISYNCLSIDHSMLLW